NIGSWMQDVGESWLMTSLTLSPVLVALVETAGSLPVVLAALPAGALADIVDRRRLLIVMQVWMVIVATAMGVMALSGHMRTGRIRRRLSLAARAAHEQAASRRNHQRDACRRALLASFTATPVGAGPLRCFHDLRQRLMGAVTSASPARFGTEFIRVWSVAWLP